MKASNLIKAASISALLIGTAIPATVMAQAGIGGINSGAVKSEAIKAGINANQISGSNSAKPIGPKPEDPISSTDEEEQLKGKKDNSGVKDAFNKTGAKSIGPKQDDPLTAPDGGNLEATKNNSGAKDTFNKTGTKSIGPKQDDPLTAPDDKQPAGGGRSSGGDTGHDTGDNDGASTPSDNESGSSSGGSLNKAPNSFIQQRINPNPDAAKNIKP